MERDNLLYARIDYSYVRRFVRTNEVWKDVVGYEGLYIVSDMGNVKSLTRYFSPEKGRVSYKPRLLKPNFTGGYLSVTLTKELKKVKIYRVHRLVAVAFIPNPHNLSEVNHKKGIKIDNRASALEWATRSENERHAYQELGANHVNGETSKKSTLTNKDIPDILNATGTHEQIAAMYNVGRKCIGNIKNGISWTHITKLKRDK